MVAACKRPAFAASKSSMLAPSKRLRGTLEFKIWPSSLDRAGHTTVRLDDPKEPLHKHLSQVPKDEKFGMRMGRMEMLPCCLVASSKFRNGAERWWCPVHQGVFGKKKQLQEAARTGNRRCEHADDPVDFVDVQDIPVLCLVPADMVGEAENYYSELGVWMGMPPSLNTLSPEKKFYPGIHVHARKRPNEKKIIDRNFLA
eukprot:5429859-Amphidinium_carterae.1